MAASDERAEAVIRHCVEVHNRCTAEWVDTCYAADVEWVELPTAAAPGGRRGQRAELRAAAEAARAVFPDRQMRIRSLVAQGGQVAAEHDWWGTAASSIGPLRAGTTLRLRIASFFAVTDGLIVRHTDYRAGG
jgi:ketosteroid isomerase-like protein